MKNYIIPIFSMGLLLSGCSAAYKTGQTPDDVYYSKPKQSAVIVQQESKPTEGYQSYFSADDAYLRMKVQNGGRWNSIDDFDYWNGYNSYNPYMNPYNSGIYMNYNPYWGMSTFSFGTGYYSPWVNSYLYAPTYYQHYYPVVINKRPTYYNQGSRPSLSGYSNPNYDRGNSRYSPAKSSFRSLFNNGGSTNSNSGSSGSYNRPSRTFSSEGSSSTPSRSYSTPSSSGSSSGSGGAGRSSSGGSSSSGRGGRGG